MKKFQPAAVVNKNNLGRLASVCWQGSKKEGKGRQA